MLKCVNSNLKRCVTFTSVRATEPKSGGRGKMYRLKSANFFWGGGEGRGSITVYEQSNAQTPDRKEKSLRCLETVRLKSEVIA